MDKEVPEFRDYGDGGDLAGAHRNRRAFRFCVISIALLTFGMWIAENFIRYGQAESLYKSGITLGDRNSARVPLLQAIKQDANANETPTAKYTRAVAVRQEDDVILDWYDKAQELDSRNSSFTLRHGSRLFILGYPGAALAKYQKAELLLDETSPNALIGYLQSASIAQQKNDPGGINDAMALAARTNNREGDIIFPKPQWFLSYPETGTHFAMLQREIIDESCAPLYEFSSLIAKAISQKIEDEQFQDAKTWISQLQRMGDRLLRNAKPAGTLQALAGITIQIQSIELIEKLEVAQIGASSEETIERRVKLSNAYRQVIEYESGRDANIEEEVSIMMRPSLLGFWTWFGFVLIWVVAWCIYQLFHLQKSAWTLQHSPFGKLVLGGGAVIFLILLIMFSALGHMQDHSYQSVTFLTWAWIGTMGLLVVLGLIYPATMLANVDDASRKAGRPEEVDQIIPYAKVVYRRVYASLTLRYYGILTGFFTMTLCLWIVLYRLATELFPWQINLLAKGFLDEEIMIVERILSAL
ncbi:MAG TPA: hypothetical protein EYN96_10765 [Candidatus Hydrogenedentes bacterium]|nr:hypothetical protein [Candidatus Hydrogenedentota bacterium]